VTRAIACIAAAILLTAAPAAAQGFLRRDTPRAGSWELGGGVTWTGGFSGSDRTAELTRNGETSGGFDLFDSSRKVTSAPGLGAALAFYASPAIAVEAGFRWSKPRLSIRLSGDFEEAGELSAEEDLTRYVFTGSVVFHLRSGPGRRLIPFVAGGAGYIRDLHEGAQLVETGTEYHALGGMKYWFGTARRRFGIRGQAGLSVSDGGFDFKDEPRTVPTASASLVYLF
jgi:hypothetical protein